MIKICEIFFDNYDIFKLSIGIPILIQIIIHAFHIKILNYSLCIYIYIYKAISLLEINNSIVS